MAAAFRSASLALIAGRLALGKHLLLGHGEEQGGGRNRESILAVRKYLYYSIGGAFLALFGIRDLYPGMTTLTL